MRLFSKFINLLLARLMKKYLKTIVFSALTLFALFFIWLKSLDIYTANNRHIQVPDFSGIHVSNLDSAFKKNNLRYIIIDSIFDKNTDKGVVVDQSPEPNFEVKKNRRIYLTINSLQRQRVYFPEIYDLTLRQAVKKLNDNKLVVGDLEYKVDIARNKILGHSVNGISINAGQELFEGTTVDLLVGKGVGDDYIDMPNLVGLNRVEANIILKTLSLNIGLEIFDSKITDSSTAIITNQKPEYIEGEKINTGSSIDLFYE